jgi:hypothetical protein
MASEQGQPLDLRAQARESARARVAEVAFNLFAERGFEQTTAAETTRLPQRRPGVRGRPRHRPGAGASHSFVTLLDEAFEAVRPDEG